MKNFSGKVAVITGAGSGLGREFALTAAGLRPDLVPGAVHSAAGLLADWPPEPAPGTVLLPLSARARPTLETGLTARGYGVLTATAYETVPWPAPAPLVRRAAAQGEADGTDDDADDDADADADDDDDADANDDADADEDADADDADDADAAPADDAGDATPDIADLLMQYVSGP